MASKLVLPKLYPAQLDVALDSHTRVCANMGRQVGKTFCGVVIGLDASWRGKFVSWVSPTYKQSGIAFTLAKRLMGHIPGVSIRESDREIRMPSGGLLRCASGDEPNNLRGITNLDLLICDEMAYCDPGLWDLLAPTLLARNGRAIFFSTPRAQNDHWHDMFRRSETDADWASHTLPSDANPHLPAGAVEKMRASMPSIVARRELDGEFVGAEGALIARDSMRFGAPPACKLVTLGCDLAVSEKASADYTACVVAGRADDGVVWILHAARDRLSFHGVVEFIQRIAAAYRPGSIVVEDVAYQRGVVTELQRLAPSLNVSGVRPEGDKMARLAPVAARVETGMVRFAADLPPWYIDELCSVPLSKNDDGADATVMAYQALAEYSGPIITFAQAQAITQRVQERRRDDRTREQIDRHLDAVLGNGTNVVVGHSADAQHRGNPGGY